MLSGLKTSLYRLADSNYDRYCKVKDWKSDLFELRYDILHAIIRRLIQPIIVLTEFLQRLRRWVPVLWSDRDYDYVNIFRILEFKIKQNRTNTQNFSQHLSAAKDVKGMQIAEQLLKRLQDPSKYVECEWNKLFETIHTLGERNETTTKETRRLMNKEEYMWNQDFEFLVKVLRKQIRHWWN